MRKVIQIITGMTGSPYMNGTKVEHSMYALCDDGTMWKHVGDNWYRLHDIPQEEPEQPATSPDVVDALRKLAKAEANFRGSFLGYEGDHFGNTRATLFRLQAQAGDAARAVLKRIDEPYSSE